MGFENKEEFRPILTTAKELLIASGEVELVKILNSAELSVIQTSYDNWNGGIYYYTMYVNVSVPDFVRLQSCNIEDIEKRILEAINTASRSIVGRGYKMLKTNTLKYTIRLLFLLKK